MNVPHLSCLIYILLETRFFITYHQTKNLLLTIYISLYYREERSLFLYPISIFPVKRLISLEGNPLLLYSNLFHFMSAFNPFTHAVAATFTEDLVDSWGTGFAVNVIKLQTKEQSTNCSGCQQLQLGCKEEFRSICWITV